MGLGAESSTTSPSGHLGVLLVTMFLLLVWYHGSCHREVSLIELKEQRQMHLASGLRLVWVWVFSPSFSYFRAIWMG